MKSSFSNRFLNLLAVLAFGFGYAAQAQDLFIDFNSTSQDGGPHPQGAPYQDYDAGHEVQTDFVTRAYSAFGTTIELTPTWPDTTDNRVEQMIDRGNQADVVPAGNDANWDDTGMDLNLMTDFLGIDTRTGNGGLGDYDGVNGSPTRMHLSLGGVPAGSYQWLSFHHDTENVHASFLVDLSTDGGVNFTNIGEFKMTDSTPGGNPNNPDTTAGGDRYALDSTLRFLFMADGFDDIVIQFTPLSEPGVHRQIFGINGFELTVVDDPDGDGLPTDWEVANGLDPNSSEGDDGADGDGDLDDSPNSEEFVRGTEANNPDTDMDGVVDGHETLTGMWDSDTDTGTNPLDDDSDNDGLLDGVENPDLEFVDENQTGTDPNIADSDSDGLSDGEEILGNTDPTDPNDPPKPEDLLAIDFNSTTQDGGPHPVGGVYQNYDAGHEVTADFVTQTYAAFDTMVGVTPSWPDTVANTVQQMIDRAAGNDNQWTGTDVDLLTDWLGADARTGQGGNGDYDGANGLPTTLLLALSDLPGGTYDWTSYHHDTENIHTPFTVDISTDGGTTFEPVGEFQMSSSSTGGNPANPAIETSGTPDSLTSTVRHSFASDGSADVVLRFIPLAQIAVHQQLVGINGFQLVRTSSNFSKFAITSIVHDLDTDMITLTWPSRPGQIFSIDTSLDLQSWPGDIEDSLQAAVDAEETSFSFLAGSRNDPENENPIQRFFFRVRILPNQ